MPLNNSKLIDKAQGVAACLTYNEEPDAPAKHVIHELCHRLGARTVRITKKRGGYLMTTLFGRERFLTLSEALVWRLFRRPPAGVFVEEA